MRQDKPRDLGISAAVDDSSDVNPAISNDQSPDSSLAAYTDIFRAGTEQTLPDTAGKLFTIDLDLLNLPLVLDEDQAFMSDTLFQGGDCLVPNLPGSWNSTLDSYNSWSDLQTNATFPKSKFADEDIGIYTILAHLRILNNPNVWSSVVSSLNTLSVEVDDTRSEINETFSTTTRDWLLSVTQHIWRTVKQEAMHRAANELDPEMCSWMDKIILLPTTDILGRLFRRYVQNEQRRFSIFPAPVGGLLTYTSKRNSVLHGLLALLIIAKSIRVSENRKVQDLSNGLVGLCRIFNYNANWSTVTEHMELSLSLIQLMQWSGEGTHTNVSHVQEAAVER
ncbi:hypothetical protein SLS60_007056 [Paraconiothyrium brasiliense]|uniref:Uncharacterized protein n=1 Tax=Paraconiothyrium brasiliense TaxID=300254 RepID=A0ABR3R8B3_9PLEO